MRNANSKKDGLCAALYVFRRAIELEKINDDPCWREYGLHPTSSILPQELLLSARLLYMQVYLFVSYKC